MSKLGFEGLQVTFKAFHLNNYYNYFLKIASIVNSW